MAGELTANHVLNHMGYTYWYFANEPKPPEYRVSHNVLQLRSHGKTRIVDLFLGGEQLDHMDSMLEMMYAGVELPYVTPEITRRVTLETFVRWVIDPESRP